jgi:hypothetical protein
MNDYDDIVAENVVLKKKIEEQQKQIKELRSLSFYNRTEQQRLQAKRQWEDQQDCLPYQEDDRRE